MSFLIRQTLIYAVPLMIVALAGIFAERSGVINLALEGIMIFGAFIGVLCVRILQVTPVFEAAKAAGISIVVVDRGGNKYTGRVAAIVDAAVEAGLAISAKKEDK